MQGSTRRKKDDRGVEEGKNGRVIIGSQIRIRTKIKIKIERDRIPMSLPPRILVLLALQPLIHNH